MNQTNRMGMKVDPPQWHILLEYRRLRLFSVNLVQFNLLPHLNAGGMSAKIVHRVSGIRQGAWLPASAKNRGRPDLQGGAPSMRLWRLHEGSVPKEPALLYARFHT
jgi:hypothetical protein